MIQRAIFLAVATALVAGCSNGIDKVDVEVRPSAYVVGSVTSDLATPAVDEVVRLKPREVHIHTCTTTPPGKVNQFNTELDARLKTAKTMSFTASGC